MFSSLCLKVTRSAGIGVQLDDLKLHFVASFLSILICIVIQNFFGRRVIKKQRHNYFKKTKNRKKNHTVTEQSWPALLFSLWLSQCLKAAVIIGPALTRHDVRLLLRRVVQ